MASLVHSARKEMQPTDSQKAHRTSLLELCEVTVCYAGGVQALQPTTLQLCAGELVVLLGPSGAGKSTLLRALNGLSAVTSGKIVRAGIGTLTSKSAIRAARRAPGMVFQQHQLVRRMTALANVLHGRLGGYSAWRTLWPLPRADRELALRCLDQVGLFGKALARVDQLSGGEQQRVAIARALAQEPELLLADEPVASLDPAAHRLMDLIQAVARAGSMLAIVSLHQVEIARQFADRIIGISAGRVVFDGPPRALDRDAIGMIYGPGGRPSIVLPERPASLVALAHSVS
jgi:phosphonate transport system ATP-binding protein